MFELMRWRASSSRMRLDKQFAAWDEVCCGDAPVEATESRELAALAHDICGIRYAARSFDGGDLTIERYLLLKAHYEKPLPFDEGELRSLAGQYVEQMRLAASDAGASELVLMLDNPVVFDDVGEDFIGEGNQLWRDVVGGWRRNQRAALPERLRRETDALSGLLRSAAWAPELGDALVGPLYPEESGFDPSLYLECWIRNAALVIGPDAVRVSRRQAGGQ